MMEKNWSILLYKEYHKGRSKWFALTLEQMVTWWADTPQEALRGLLDALVWQVDADLGAGQEPFSLCPRAPERYWKLFQEAAPIQFTKAPAAISGEIRLAA
jgi:hypothetical protein